MSDEWKWLISSVNGLPHRVPNNESAVASHVLRGFEPTDIPGELNSDDLEFAEARAEWQARKDEEAKKAKSEAKSATKSKKEDE
jgi:hypothetical protein